MTINSLAGRTSGSVSSNNRPLWKSVLRAQSTHAYAFSKPDSQKARSLARDVRQGEEPVRRASPDCAGTARVAKILFLGNSITLHGPAESIGWSRQLGHGGQRSDKDFVHLLVARIAQTPPVAQPEVLVRNLADFERQYETFDPASASGHARL